MSIEKLPDEILSEALALDKNGVSDDELYKMLADSAGLGADEINKAAEGKTLFSRIWLRKKNNLCNNSVVQAYIKDPNAADATILSAQIVNVFIAVPGVNVAVVCCLVIRIGLRKLCAGSGNAT
jgi:hypothetical protein